jgi:SAM-dependent methyltransferase
MNLLHRWLCRSDRWRATVRERIPWALRDTNLGAAVLEIGPGPGLTTDVLSLLVQQLTALEIDRRAASSLAARLEGSNVRVIHGDATNMPFRDSAFSSAVAFTMLHHVPSQELQDRVLREAFRVLKPGGFFVGSDSLTGWLMRIIHVGDTLVPVNPDTFAARLHQAGFEVLDVEKQAEAFRFRARRPEIAS